jgi:hypothetical protein
MGNLITSAELEPFKYGYFREDIPQKPGHSRELV